jgi:hypothetical protein
MTLQKTESFVPLTTAGTSSNHREFQVTVIPQSGQSQSYQNLDKSALPAIEASPLGAKKHCEPYMSMQRDGDRITNIRIQCSCGQVIDLACVYDETSKLK